MNSMQEKRSPEVGSSEDERRIILGNGIQAEDDECSHTNRKSVDDIINYIGYGPLQVK